MSLRRHFAPLATIGALALAGCQGDTAESTSSGTTADAIVVTQDDAPPTRAAFATASEAPEVAPFPSDPPPLAAPAEALIDAVAEKAHGAIEDTDARLDQAVEKVNQGFERAVGHVDEATRKVDQTVEKVNKRAKKVGEAFKGVGEAILGEPIPKRR